MPVKYPQTDRVGSNFILSVVNLYPALCLSSLPLITPCISKYNNMKKLFSKLSKTSLFVQIGPLDVKLCP